MLKNFWLVTYNRFFALPSLQVVELTAEVVDIATDLRVGYANSLRTPDALQLACALTAHADQFVTGDKKLSGIQEIVMVIV